jgi:cytochrome c-type biogenesis protein CcmH
MNGFLIVVACLVFGAWLFLLPPMWRRGDAGGANRLALIRRLYRDKAAELDADLGAGQMDAAHHTAARAELERDLARELALLDETPTRADAGVRRWPAWLLALGLPLGAVILYWQVGNPDSLRQLSSTPMPGSHPLGRADVEAMITQLAGRLAGQPDDFAGWAMLGRSYTALGRYNDAAMAYAKAVALNDHDATVLLEYADILGVVRGKDLRGKPSELIRRALEIDPNHPKALALAGTAAFNERQFVQAADYWERLLRLLQPGSESARGVAGSIAEAKALASGLPVLAAPVAAASLSGTVTLSPVLAARVAPDDTLFIYARAVDGPPMPVVALKRRARDLPLRFQLDDSMAMIAGRPLSSLAQVMVGARLSRTANALPASGDLEGLLGPVRPGARDLALTIDRVRP